MTGTATPIGVPVHELPTPALLVDASLLEANLAAMRAAFKYGTALCRPHVKSHKSPRIAALQIAAGASGLCCAKLGEAEVMFAGGVGDVHITTPVVGAGKTGRLARLAGAGRVSVVADDADNLLALSRAAVAAGSVIDVLIEMDVGQGRCGVQSAEAVRELAEVALNLPGLRLRGLQGYHGRLQSVVDFRQRRNEVLAAMERLQAGVAALNRLGLTAPVLTGGGTGSLPIDLELGFLNELQPGSYVFMDATYRGVRWDPSGARIPFANALTVLAGVISRPLRDRAVLDVGWKALSSDSGAPVLKGEMAVAIEFAGDEHSLVTGDAARGLRLGERVEIVPSHCDTTVNLYDRFHVVRDGVVEALWPIAARGRSD
jgi:D-serine deaminase-like pyridoxal phosphate-dependent protein